MSHPLRPPPIREEDIYEASRTDSLEERPRRVEQPARAQPVPQRPAPGSPARSLRALLASRDGVRQAILLQEILGPPKSLRREEDPFGP